MSLFSRPALRPAELATEPARRLVDLCLTLGLDGEFSDADLRRLTEFVDQQGDDVRAIAHLRALLHDAFLDGVISDAERALLHRQIERTLPADERTRLAASRKQLESERQSARRAEEEKEFNRPTKSQRADIAELGGVLPDDATRRDAAALIEKLLHSNASITPRQRMVLRFWNRTPDPTWGKIDVSEWLDAWYGADPERAMAWEAFQKSFAESGHTPTLADVPVGAGPGWLEKVKSGTHGTSGAFATRPKGWLTVFGVLAVLAGVLFVVLRK